MKAIRIYEFGPPEVMKLEEVPDLKPGLGQVAVRMHAAGVNPVETYIRSGIYPKPPTPYTPGADGAGIVEAIGEGVTRVTVGDRVYTAGSVSGTYAEQTLCKESQVHPLPERASFAQGAAVNVPYATAYRALVQRAQASPGEVVIPGMVANLNVGNDLNVLAQGGRVAVIGNRGTNNQGTAEINPRAAMNRDAAILGTALVNASPRDLASIHAALVAGLENGALRPVIGQEF